ncbi:hypothetical protein ACWDFH_21760 [Streptomyces kronopolitis]
MPLFFGLLLVLVSAGLFAAVPGAEADNRAYAAASACPTSARQGSCTTTVPATVKGTENEPSGKSVHHWLLLTERGSKAVRRVRMAGSAPVYGAVRVGDEVSLTYWRGEIRSVRFGAATQQAWTHPAEDGRLPAAFGFLTLGFGLSTLVMGLGVLWIRARRRDRSPSAVHAAYWRLTAGGVAPLVPGCLGFTTSSMGDAVGDAFVTTAVGTPPILLLTTLCMWWMARRMRRGTDISGIVAVPPTQKQCVGAAVHGDVPYSVEGFGYLVVGDGRPAVTPDPDGRFARRTLPETLTVRCVRPLGLDDDADLWRTHRTFDCVIIECRDADRPVLIATRKRHASLILGALAS